MKIEMKRDDPSLKDVIVEIEPGDYYNPAQFTAPVKISVLQLVEFYEEWKGVAFQMKTMVSMKGMVNSIYGRLVELEKMIRGEDDD